jgi:hypothetical protein
MGPFGTSAERPPDAFVAIVLMFIVGEALVASFFAGGDKPLPYERHITSNARFALAIAYE